jgi:hypothetical protein
VQIRCCLCGSSLSTNGPSSSTCGRTVLAEIDWSVIAVLWDNGAVLMKMMATMAVRGRVRAVVVYLWALRAVSYGAFSNNATGMPIAMKPHCGCAFLMTVTEQDGLSYPQ